MDTNEQTTLEQEISTLAENVKGVASMQTEAFQKTVELMAKTAENLQTISENLVNKEKDDTFEKLKETDNDAFRKMFIEANDADRKKIEETYGARVLELALQKDGLKKTLAMPIHKSDPLALERKEIHDIHDQLLITAAINGAISKSGTSDKTSINRDKMRESLAVVQKTNPYLTPAQQMYLKGANDALDNVTAGDGLEAIPINMSNTFIEEMFLQLRVASLFPRIEMTSGTFRLPALSSRPRARFVGPGTTPAQFGTNMGVSDTFDTYEVSLTARKLMTETIWNDEVEEDAIPAFANEIRNYLINGHVASLEDAILNGTTTVGTTLDNAAAAKLWTDTADPRAAFNGIRRAREIANIPATSVDASTLTLQSLRAARASLGKYGVDPSQLVLIVSPAMLYRMLSIPEAITMQNFGTQATIFSGTLPQLDGIQLVVSEFVYQNLNASGVFDNLVTNRTLGVLVHRDAYRLGIRRDVRVETDRSVLSGQNVIVSTNRADFTKVRPTVAQEAILRGVTI